MYWARFSPSCRLPPNSLIVDNMSPRDAALTRRKAWCICSGFEQQRCHRPTTFGCRTHQGGASPCLSPTYVPVHEGQYSVESISHRRVVHFTVKAVAETFHGNQLALDVPAGQGFTHEYGLFVRHIGVSVAVRGSSVAG